MKRDVASREDLIAILEAFYKKAFKDELIGHFFTEVVPLNLDTHIPIIADFWEGIVLGNYKYRKNVMDIHKHIHDLSAIKKVHLDRWVQLFTGTISDQFEGENAELMKQRALSVATLMDIRLNHTQGRL